MIDSHVHLQHIKFDDDRREVIMQCRRIGITRFINSAITYEDNVGMFEKLKVYPEIFYSIGIHPTRLEQDESKDEIRYQKLVSLLEIEDRIVAIGETGLDYHMSISEEEKHRQQAWFKTFLQLAQIQKKPVVLHIRDAYEDAIGILRNYFLKEKGMVHCFCGSNEHARIFTEEMGLLLGIGAKLLKMDGLKGIVKNLPLECIVLETDSPYLATEKKQRNTPMAVIPVAEEIARLKGCAVEEVYRVTDENVNRKFCI